VSVLRTIPAVISFLLIGAHFLRRGDHPIVFLCLLLLPLPFVRRWPARFLSIVLLSAGGVGWLVIAWRLAEARQGLGEPYTRMTLILGGVALFTFFSAWLLPGVSSRERAAGPGASPGRRSPPATSG